MSVIQSREVSAVRSSQCTVKYIGNDSGVLAPVCIVEVSVVLGGVRCQRFHCITIATHTNLKYHHFIFRLTLSVLLSSKSQKIYTRDWVIVCQTDDPLLERTRKSRLLSARTCM